MPIKPHRRTTAITDLTGKVAIVTGGARGLGESIAWALVENGATVVVADVLDGEGERTVAAMTDAGFRATYRSLDVRNTSGWTALASETKDSFGRIDCLVNNAGVNYPGSVEEATVEQFHNLLDINLLGAFRGMQAVIPYMKGNGGSIINMASATTRKVVPMVTIYSAAKAALANLTKTSAAWLGKDGIRVVSVHPGAHDTEMVRQALNAIGDPTARKAAEEDNPMKRLGHPTEVGALVAFLASDAASYISGGEYFIDGAKSNI